VSREPYIVRKLTRAQMVPVLVFVVWVAILMLTGFDIPTVFLVVVTIYVVVVSALNLERLRVDEKGIRVRPAGRIPWEHVQSVTYRGPHAVALKLKPGSPLPRGVRGMVDGEVTLPARGIELDQGPPRPGGPRLRRRRRLVLGEAGQRRALLRQVGRRAERLILDLGAAVVGLRRLVGDLGLGRRDVAHARSPTRSSAGAPQSRNTEGSTTDPSSCCPFSISAIMNRHVTAVPFSVAT
jgi:hypothetical protein